MKTSNIRFVDGFTMVELMVTIAVMAILAAVAVPSMQGILASSRLTSDANDVLAALNLARSEAIRLNRRVVFCRVGGSVDSPDLSACLTSDPGGKWTGWMVFGDSDADGVLDVGTEDVLRAGAFSSSSLTVLSSPALKDSVVANRIVFRADGIAKSQGTNTVQQVNLRICDSKHSNATDDVRDISVMFGSRMGVSRGASADCSAPANP